jgi:hypothetical protein
MAAAVGGNLSRLSPGVGSMLNFPAPGLGKTFDNFLWTPALFGGFVDKAISMGVEELGVWPAHIDGWGTLGTADWFLEILRCFLAAEKTTCTPTAIVPADDRSLAQRAATLKTDDRLRPDVAASTRPAVESDHPYTWNALLGFITPFSFTSLATIISILVAFAIGLHWLTAAPLRRRLESLELQLSALQLQQLTPPADSVYQVPLLPALRILDSVYPSAVAAAADNTLRAGTRVITLGRLTMHDGGDWQYIVSPSKVPADGGVAIDMAIKGLQLRALHRGSATTLQYGCVCDCKTDSKIQLQSAFNFQGESLIVNGQNTYFTSKQLNADVPNRCITLVAGCTLAALAPMTTVIAVNGASNVIIDGRGCIDADHKAKAGILLRCTGDGPLGSNMVGCEVNDITVQNTAVDVQLFCGGIQVDNKTGKGAQYNCDGLIITGVTVKNCGTHGVLVACELRAATHHSSYAIG